MNLHGRLALIIGFVLAISACGGGLVGMKIKGVDENNVPIEDAHVAIHFSLSEGSNSYRGITNRKGEASATRLGAYGTLYRITKEGYYDSAGEFSFGNQDVTLILRKKENPIPMYSKKAHLHSGTKDAGGLWVGYDLMIGDYMPPWGKGMYKDFETKYTYEKTDIYNLRYDLSIRFSNVGDGLIIFKVEDFSSEIKSNYLAPKEGYVNIWEFHRYRSNSGVGESYDTNLDKFRRYYFRVRTKIDKDGNVISALYGKLYSEFPDLHYYLNPNENDRNVEFDPRQNLFVNLPKEERQLEP
jgi:hypothetical protein